jgi:hypothetical protein
LSTPFLRFLFLFGSLILLAEISSGEVAAPAPSGAVRDTLLTVRSGDSLSGIANRLLSLSDHYTNTQMVTEIRRYNALPSDTLRPGQKLRVQLRYQEATIPIVSKPWDFEARGIYANAQIAGSPRILDLADRLVEAGGNTIVFDIKDRPGDLSYNSQVPLAVAIKASSRSTIPRPDRLVDLLHRRGIHVVARITCFYDTRLARAYPDLVPRSRQTEGPWHEKGHPGWLDPSLPQVQDYLLAIIKEVADIGVDEIQLDYIRFPTEGNVEDAVFAYDPETVAKHQVITGFLSRVRQTLKPTRVLLSADIFGVIAWGRTADMESTGQNLRDMLPLLDAISPMLYPSHFYGRFDQISNPAAHPYYFVYKGCRHLSRLAATHEVAVRPWIQAFTYRVAKFDRSYITEQLHGAEEGGARGWLLWNSAGRYKLGLAAIDQFENSPAPVDSTVLQKRIPPIEPAGKQDQAPLGARLGNDNPGSSFRQAPAAE